MRRNARAELPNYGCRDMNKTPHIIRSKLADKRHIGSMVQSRHAALLLVILLAWRGSAIGKEGDQYQLNHRGLENATHQQAFKSPGRVVMTYTTLTHMGLCNQLLVLKYAFMLAYTLGAEVVLAPARKRKSFSMYYVSDPFEEVPIDTLLDAQHIRAYWAKLGMIVHEVCPNALSWVMW